MDTKKVETPAKVPGPFSAFIQNTGIIIGILAIEAFVLTWIWNTALSEPLKWVELSFGNVFLILVGFRILFRDLNNLSTIRNATLATYTNSYQTNGTLNEIRDILIFSEGNKTSQFASVVALLTADIKDREAREASARREKEAREAIEQAKANMHTVQAKATLETEK